MGGEKVNFRTARLSAGLSVAQVVEALSVSDAAVYQWETGVTTPNTKRIIEVAKLYGVTVDYLLAEDGSTTEVQ
nr:MAG TPA: helix-turn-helix domain protein [Caudoviricetes sp.]